jgi:hypothetical protein
MKRAQKINLLKRVFQNTAPSTTRNQISQALQEESRGLVVIHDLPAPGKSVDDTTIVSFNDQGIDHRMSLGELYQYVDRHFISTLFLLPAKEELAYL